MFLCYYNKKPMLGVINILKYVDNPFMKETKVKIKFKNKR